MIGSVLLIPMLLIRYGLPLFADKNAVKRLAFSPPTKGRERIAFIVYQLSTLAVLIYLFFVKIAVDSVMFYIGASLYCTGILLYALSIIDFAKPSGQGINTNGLYRFSRNPIYMAFLIFLLGCVLITGSSVLFVLSAIFQISVHWIILSEERWCLSEFGEEYEQYMKKVRRYL